MANQALAATTSRAAGGLDQINVGSTVSIRQIGTGARLGMAGTVNQSQTSGTAAVSEFQGVLDAQIGEAVPALDGLLDQHRTSLANQRAQLRPPTGEATGTLGNRIDTAQTRAAERARRGWLANQLSDLWNTITSPEFLVGLVVGLLIAAVSIGTAGSATPFVIMAAGIAAGAAAGAAGTITGNIRGGRRGWDILHNVGRNTLIGAAAGAVAAGVYLFGTGVVAGLGLSGTALTVGGFVVLGSARSPRTRSGTCSPGSPGTRTCSLRCCSPRSSSDWPPGSLVCAAGAYWKRSTRRCLGSATGPSRRLRAPLLRASGWSGSRRPCPTAAASAMPNAATTRRPASSRQWRST
ncbi:MAG TPA: hypothetical protein VFQ77_03220 [Pseudonocardiaceae bacterium]|nr:hypothetical protein [Pseudonocardiaceae bacterium]